MEYFKRLYQNYPTLMAVAVVLVVMALIALIV